MIGAGSMLRRGLVGCAIVIVAATMGCRAAPPPVGARILTDWMRAQYALVRAERLSPPVASRVFAYGAVALYEGVAAGSPRLRSLAGQLNGLDRKSTRLNSSHLVISYAVFCLKKKKHK